MNKPIFILVTVLVAILIVLPAITVTVWHPNANESVPPSLEFDAGKKQIQVSVYVSKEGKVIHLPMEDYIRGVVAAEMPANFEPEALKAQALAARTFIVRRIVDKDFSTLPKRAKELNAMVTDTVSDQVYISDESLRQKWGLLTYSFNMKKLKDAVQDTEGQVITYEGRPIEASFFSTSNGYTENSEDYWNQSLPYLKSVESPWDEVAPKFKQTVTFPINEVNQKLGSDLVAVPVMAGSGTSSIQVLEQSEGKRIKKVKIGSKILTGREVRERLGLNSSHFAAQVRKDNVSFTTYGLGHGVGMSQWGANGMAKQGKTAEEIVKYYYRGVSIHDYRDWISG
ncbi:MAG: stage II sporulation protein D [Bacilli bacterium]